MEEKNLQLERLVFFCDAVVAIAITLLALDIRLEPVPGGHLHFSDLKVEWRSFLAFLLSFINIANFWRTHHRFFVHIKQIDERVLWYNIFWLFFIVVLPFSTSLVSSYFSDTAAIFTYSLNILCIAIFQNMIWDYVSLKPEFLKPETFGKYTVWSYRIFCNMDMINALVAMALSFWRPPIAFIMLFTKFPVHGIVRFIYPDRFREMIKEQWINRKKPAASQEEKSGSE